MIHSVEDKRKLESHAAFFAAAGSLTDYMENKSIASSIVSQFDRQFLMLESTALSHMISAKQNDNEFLVEHVKFLSIEISTRR